jgi:Clp amino terminal domain, pathogenicity island component
MFERYTEKARRVIFFARYEAAEYGSPYIETEHLLLGLLRENKALAKMFLEQGNVEVEIRAEIEQHITRRERISTSVEVPLTVESKGVLHLAAEESERLGHRHIGTEHVLLGLLGAEGSLAARLLQARGLTAAAVRECLAKIPRPGVVSVKTGRDPNARLKLDSFLAGLKWHNKGEELLEFFAQNAQFIDVCGKFWNRNDISKGFETLFAPYAKKNAAPLVEETLADASGLFVATVVWKNAILASMQRTWIHRMSVVLIREREDWRILLMQVTAVHPL